MQNEDRRTKVALTELQEWISTTNRVTVSNRLAEMLQRRLHVPSPFTKGEGTMNAIFICTRSHINSMNSSQTRLTYISCLTL